ncbi:MAG TPA: cation:proton antiporter [Acidimicrobiales bacterium]|nr:cation:proton antiporter [Acidimicrobiales bacterium]
MTDTPFALAIIVAACAGLVVLAASRLSSRSGVPLPAVVLFGAAAVGQLAPSLQRLSPFGVQRVVTVALVLVLFDGGMHLGWGRLRGALAAVGLVGVAGTFITAGVAAVAVHLVLGVGWYAALLVATALAPTDPTVVFSVLGRRRIAGDSGTVLEAESGANDPVGIALMASLVGAGRLGAGQALEVAGTFLEQMGIGLAVGLLAGRLLLLLMRRLPLPAEGLYPLRTLAAAFAVYAAGALAHGSGFLAVFVAGIVIGDGRAPFKLEVERFHGALASLGEIVAFAVLGLTVRLPVLGRPDVWGPALAIWALLAAVVRPLAVGPLLALTGRMRRNERLFVVFAGLKGAVPILLGGYLFAAHLADADRLYGVVVVVVALSVVAQGGTVGVVASRLRLPVSIVEPQPWAVGVRLPDAPDDVLRVTVRSGSDADGAEVAALDALPAGAWISLLVRDGRLIAVRGDTRLQAGDDLTIVGVEAGAAHALARSIGRAAG